MNFFKFYNINKSVLLVNFQVFSGHNILGNPLIKNQVFQILVGHILNPNTENCSNVRGVNARIINLKTVVDV